jgi:dephospho-CoA kinase
MLLKVGLTGGIACGKSMVAEMLFSLGCFVFDADKECKLVLAQGGSAYHQVVSLFGGDILDEKGDIDRRRLAAIIFSDAEKRRRLEAIIHPLVMNREEVWWEDVASNYPEATAVTDAPLIIERGLLKRYHRIVVVFSPPSLQINRLIEKGVGSKEAQLRIKAQLPCEEKIRYAHYVIRNNGDVAQLEERVRELYRALLYDLRVLKGV